MMEFVATISSKGVIPGSPTHLSLQYKKSIPYDVKGESTDGSSKEESYQGSTLEACNLNEFMYEAFRLGHQMNWNAIAILFSI